MPLHSLLRQIRQLDKPKRPRVWAKNWSNKANPRPFKRVIQVLEASVKGQVLNKLRKWRTSVEAWQKWHLKLDWLSQTKSNHRRCLLAHSKCSRIRDRSSQSWRRQIRPRTNSSLKLMKSSSSSKKISRLARPKRLFSCLSARKSCRISRQELHRGPASRDVLAVKSLALRKLRSASKILHHRWVVLWPRIKISKMKIRNRLDLNNKNSGSKLKAKVVQV